MQCLRQSHAPPSIVHSNCHVLISRQTVRNCTQSLVVCGTRLRGTVEGSVIFVQHVKIVKHKIKKKEKKRRSSIAGGNHWVATIHRHFLANDGGASQMTYPIKHIEAYIHHQN